MTDRPTASAQVGTGGLYVRESGKPRSPAIVFLHGEATAAACGLLGRVVAVGQADSPVTHILGGQDTKEQ